MMVYTLVQSHRTRDQTSCRLEHIHPSAMASDCSSEGTKYFEFPFLLIIFLLACSGQIENNNSSNNKTKQRTITGEQQSAVECINTMGI